MAARARPLAVLFIFSFLIWLPLQRPLSGATRLELAEGETGRILLAALLRDGEAVTFTWKNSIFGQVVTEVFAARAGELVLTEITFADPKGTYQMPVMPEDVDDLYHTGGPFSARGLSRPFSQVVYRVGEIGNPKMQVGNRMVEFKKEVGFGGRVTLTTRKARLYESIFYTLSTLTCSRWLK